MTKCKRLGMSVAIMALLMVVVISTFLPALPAYGQEKPIVVGMIAALSGPDSTSGIPSSYGYIDRIKLENERGGIYGRKIKILWEDTRGDTGRFLTGNRRFLGAGQMVNVSYAGCFLDAIWRANIKAEVPMLCDQPWAPQYHKSKLGSPETWVFMRSPGYICEGLVFADFLKKDLGIEGRPLRVAVMVAGESTCLGALQDFQDIPPAAESGIEKIGTEVLPIMGCVDSSIEWMRIMKGNPDITFLSAFGSSQIIALKDALKLGVLEKGQILGFSGIIDKYISDAVGGMGKLEGAYNLLAYPYIGETDLPGVQTLLEAAKRYRGWEPEEIPGVWLICWNGSDVAIEALKKAAEKVGVNNITGRDVRDALATLDYDSGLFKHRLQMSEERPWYLNYFRLQKVVGGKWVMIRDYKEFGWVPSYFGL